MMGRGHVLSGVLVGLATVPLVPGVTESVLAGGSWVAVFAGATLVPDIDHPGTTVSRMWGPLSSGVRTKIGTKKRTVFPGLSQMIGTVSGGHRQGTHCLLAVALSYVLFWGLGLTSIGTAVALAFCTGLALSTVGTIIPGSQWVEFWPANLGASVLLGGTLVYGYGVELPVWLPVAVAGGTALHILGDMITRSGCPLLWPLSGRKYSLSPMRAGGVFERRVLQPAMLGGCGILALSNSGVDLIGTVMAAL